MREKTTEAVAMLGDADGRLQRRHLPLNSWRMPRSVRVSGDGELLEIEWGFHFQHREDGLLERFLALANARPSSVEAFVRKYGALGLQDPGAPGSGWFDAGIATTEPLATWRMLARGFGATLAVARSLHHGAPPAIADWLGVVEVDHWIDRRRQPPGWNEEEARADLTEWAHEVVQHEPDSQKIQLAGTVSGWIEYTSTRPRLAWSDDVPAAIHLGGAMGWSVLGALTMQLAALICAAGSVEQCSGCPSMFAPKRRASSGRRRYCAACRTEGVPQRDANRDWRARHGKKARKGQQP